MDWFFDRKYPKNWKEVSFDFKLFLAFHAYMMVLFVVSSLFTIQIQTSMVSVLFVCLAVLSIRHRIMANWHWPRVRFRDIALAVLTVATGAYFLYAATVCLPSLSGNAEAETTLKWAFFPWFAGACAILLFWVLWCLHLVDFSETEFQEHCGERQSTTKPAKSHEASWKMAVRVLFYIYFFSIWLIGIIFFLWWGKAYRDGSPMPTARQTETLANHGKIVYITLEDKKAVTQLEYATKIGMPLLFLLGGLIHYVLGIKLIPNAQTIRERFGQAADGST